MKFGSGLGWTRDFDNPHKDDEDPHKGVLAEFFERVFHKHNERGEKLYFEDSGAESVNESPKPSMSQPILMIRFYTTGDPKLSIPVRKAKAIDKRDYPAAWKAFTEGKSFTSQTGTPLDVLRDLDIMNKATLNAAGFFGIEQLAQAPESVLLGNPGLRNWVNTAREYLSLHRPKTNPNQELLDKMAAMEAELASLKAAKAPKTNKNQEGIAA